MARIYSSAPAWTGTIGSGGVADASVTTIPLASATGLTNGAYYILSIDRVDASGNPTPSKWEVVAGQLSGTNLINCARGVEGTAQAHSAGATVEVLFTSYHWQQLKEYLETEHNADGTHGNITATSVKTDTIDEKTSGAGVSITKPIVLTEQSSTPTTPSSGKQTFFVRNDGNPYILKSTGSYYYVQTEELGGWIPANETWTYASPTSFTVSGDLTSKYVPGVLIRLTQSSTTKYFRVLSSSHSSGTTTVLVNSISGDTIANASITNNFYMRAIPAGLPDNFGLSNRGYIITDNLSSDYMLRRGERAIRTFSNTTSVPLNIATESGTVYKMIISPSNNYSNSGGSSSNVFFNPNNTTYSNAFHETSIYRNSSTFGTTYQMVWNSFRIGFSFLFLQCVIQNYTSAKLIIGQTLLFGVTTEYPTFTSFANAWNNTTTAWTSLGTVVFPQNTSGVIYVERLV